MVKFILEIDLGDEDSSINGTRKKYEKVERATDCLLKKTKQHKINFIDLLLWGKSELKDENGNAIGNYKVVP